MEKRHALIISLLITVLVGVNYFYFVGFDSEEREIVIIGRVIDGDTVDLEDGRRIRLVNINTPEKGREGYEEAKNFLALYENESVELEIVGVGKYGRILGRLFFEDLYLNLELVEEGFAHSSFVEGRELKEFRNVEKKARDGEKGIWKRSENYGCLNVEINKKEEYVVIEDSCESNFEGWSVKDETTKRYVFDKDVGTRIKVFSGKGVDNETEVYWGRGNVWNDDKDSIFIRDSGGKLVFYDSYGY